MKGSKKLLLHLNKLLTRNIASAKNKDPEWYKLYRDSELGTTGIYQSRKVSNSINKFVKNHPGKALASLSLFGHNPSLIIPTAAGAGAGYTGLKGIEYAYRYLKHPTLRNYYNGVISGAINDNPTMVSQNLNKLNTAMQKMEKTKE